MRLILFLLCISISYLNAQNFLHVDGKQIIDKNGDEVILRGIGLGGHMLQEGYMLKAPFSGQQYVFRDSVKSLIGDVATEEFYSTWLKNHTQKTDIDSLKKWGFNSIRLPMHFNLFTLPVDQEPVKGENTWLDKGFMMTDSLLRWCESNEMYLILDMHAAPGGQGHDLNISDRDPSKPSLWESEENKQKLIELWKKLASRYKDEEWIGGYDLINEPNWAFEEGKNKNGLEETKNIPLKELMVELTQLIRSIDSNHIIIIEGNGWGNNYNGIFPPWDENMVVSFHKYWNYNRKEDIQWALDIRDKYDIPIWLGESGENSNVWFRDAIKLMEENGIGWCWWPLKKLGYNNPLQVKINEGYHDILSYWRGEKNKPSREKAAEAFMQLAEDLKMENNIINYDVIDAMFRQVRSNEVLPFKDHMKNGNVILAVDYDLGIIEKAYYDHNHANYYISTGGDRQKWNSGGTYRNDGVDIYVDEIGEYYISDFTEGEWLHYTFDIDAEIKPELSLIINAKNNEAKISVFLNENLIDRLTISPKQKFDELTIGRVQLKKGHNTIKILVEKGSAEFKSILFTDAS
ncbi:cellulase family glycosylhydrolase [Marinigracilibium pacificum]|uniref:Cellulase family glycosylhydrolase n=1 Tax=Marinigracilibium pacificum TaxID=2729599 RepID=A0A848J7I7_9BACT|nr:cellulase family glycosylhydrolase [Marinigracilibium pacificum]NMM50394.1 cellulase family glycosylhydrolase [Marinigracilibium pacificum]